MKKYIYKNSLHTFISHLFQMMLSHRWKSTCGPLKSETILPPYWQSAGSRLVLILQTVTVTSYQALCLLMAYQHKFKHPYAVRWPIVAPIYVKTLKQRQSGWHFANNISKYIFFNKDIWCQIEISLKVVPKGPINTKPALFQIMVRHWTVNKLLSELFTNTYMHHLATIN